MSVCVSVCVRACASAAVCFPPLLKGTARGGRQKNATCLLSLATPRTSETTATCSANYTMHLSVQKHTPSLPAGAKRTQPQTHSPPSQSWFFSGDGENSAHLTSNARGEVEDQALGSAPGHR